MTYIDYNKYEPNEDGNHYRLETDKNVYHIRADSRSGFWSVTVEKGRQPNALQGSFTSLFQAQREIEKYLKVTK